MSASILEKDRAHCRFYLMTGACPYIDQCSSLHVRPTILRTLLLSHLYQRPDTVALGCDAKGKLIDPRRLRQRFEFFYEDIYIKLNMYGAIESIDVCDNLTDHMIGNVYVKFEDDEQAAEALEAIQGRSYRDNPVTDIRQATCLLSESNKCPRRGYCDLVHVKKIGRELRRTLFQ